jgi:hypothetical protein
MAKMSFRRYGLHVREPYATHSDEQITVVSKEG